MDQIIVSDTETFVVNTDNENTVVVDNTSAITIVTGLMGPKGRDGSAAPLSNLPDVDISNIKDGSILIYSVSAGMWQAGNTLSNQILEAGQY